MHKPLFFVWLAVLSTTTVTAVHAQPRLNEYACAVTLENGTRRVVLAEAQNHAQAQSMVQGAKSRALKPGAPMSRVQTVHQCVLRLSERFSLPADQETLKNMPH